MHAGMVGLGRMGGGLAERAARAGHTITAFDADPARSDVASLDELVAALPAPRVLWLMLPAGDVTEQALTSVIPLLAPGDILIEGGNSHYADTIRRAALASDAGLRYLDIGTSGGIRGVENGFCLMVGGPRDAYHAVAPLLDALAQDGSHAYVGESGAGHYAKMVHNAIEYGAMQALAEGFDLLHASPFAFDLEQVARLWNQNSVVRSWLLQLAGDALASEPGLESLAPRVDDSGEGRWAVQEAVDLGLSAPVITSALYARFASRDDEGFSARLLAALRREFGGHATHPDE